MKAMWTCPLLVELSLAETMGGYLPSPAEDLPTFYPPIFS